MSCDLQLNIIRLSWTLSRRQLNLSHASCSLKNLVLFTLRCGYWLSSLVEVISLSLSHSLPFLLLSYFLSTFSLSLLLSHTSCPLTLDASAKAALRLPVLLDKVSSLRSSRNSMELTQLAETTLNNLKVSHDTDTSRYYDL